MLEYFLRDGLFEQFRTRSIRGQERPQDDPYAHQRGEFADWGTRAGWGMIDMLAELQRITHLAQASDDRAYLESALDDVEYLMEVLDPELQPTAYALHSQIREKLGQSRPPVSQAVSGVTLARFKPTPS